MDDWISHHFIAFWIAFVGGGTVIGALFLSESYGLPGALAAGAIGGAGSALIISANRYIGSSHHEDEEPRS